MTEWLFDLGNTRLKWANSEAGSALSATAHDDLHPPVLPDDVRGDVAWLASVAAEPLGVRTLVQLSQRFSRVHCVRSQARCGVLELGYVDATQLGVDRFLAMLAIVPVVEPTLLVGVGTALTLDAVAHGGRHLGGAIAPSPSMMREALAGISTRLPAQGGHACMFADNTLDALASGCEGAALALIRERRRSLEIEADAPARLQLHGGGAGDLARALPDAAVHDNLVIEGLRVWRRLMRPSLA